MMLTYSTIHALAVNAEGKYLLLERASNRPRSGTWNVVTGYIKEKEPAEYAATRELKEETGLVGRIIRAAEPFWIDRENVRWVINAFLIEVKDTSSLHIDPGEASNYKWTDAKDQLIQEGDAVRETFFRLGLLEKSS